MKKNAVLIALILFSLNSFPQNDYIPAAHPVYDFLNMLSTKGILENYEDVVLPLSRKEIIDFLSSSAAQPKHLNSNEQDIVEKYLNRFQIGDNIVSISNNNFSSFFSDTEKRLYFYNDSSANLSIDPVFDVSGIYSGKNKAAAWLINFGGKASGSYDDWLGFSVQTSNGFVRGNRETALKDFRVQKSFTFNNTGINYFDETTGHLALHFGILDLQFGRERILWGNGAATRTILSDNPPLFDFLRLKLVYNSLSYNFLHGWLVQPPEERYVDLSTQYIKSKQPKYIALNRLGFRIPGKVNLGVTQAIIYGNRPVEAAYLNPFLLWESAQRSLNDLDNSFLILDGEIKIFNGITLAASYLFDDINFDFFDDWNNISNRSGWQVSSRIAFPYIPQNFQLKADYTQIRPYTFSHHGVNEALTYTNNGYLLGYPFDPNSGLLHIILDYYTTADLMFRIVYEYLLHGNNVTSEDGKIIMNYGGDVFSFYRFFDPDKAYLFEGKIEKKHNLTVYIDYEFLHNYFFSIAGSYSSINNAGNKESLYSLTASLKLFYE